MQTIFLIIAVLSATAVLIITEKRKSNREKVIRQMLVNLIVMEETKNSKIIAKLDEITRQVLKP